MKLFAVEEHWTFDGLESALADLSGAGADPSVAFNAIGDNRVRLGDIAAGRLAFMDEQGVAMQLLSLAPPATQPLDPAQAVTLSREANDLAAAAVSAHPDRFGALATLPMPDPAAAVQELRRAVTELGFVGAMINGRTGQVPLDDPAYFDLLAEAAELGCPIFIHPQIPPLAVREASYSGIGADVDLGLATFGWGWHLEAGLAALRLILCGTFDRHPDLQIVLGHWGEVLLFWLDRAESLSRVATGLERRVSEYVRANLFIATSGMLTPRLLRHALEYTSIDRILYSGDYPFHRNSAEEITGFLAACDEIAGAGAAQLVASENAERLFGLR